MNCPSCGTQNQTDALFCSRCSAQLQTACAECGRLNSPDAAFCGGCGASLGGTSASPVEDAAKPSGTLIVERGVPDLGPIYLDPQQYIIGNSPGADIVLDNPYISRHHAQISMDGDPFSIQDMGSTNGTFVNGSRLEGEPQWLRNGDQIEFAAGQVVIRFEQQASGTLVLDAVPPPFGSKPGTLKLGAAPAGSEPKPADQQRLTAPDGTVTIMFSDIEGSTAMTERLGDQKAQEVINGHNSTVRQQLAAYGGFEVKAQGDGFMVAFPSARRAVLCALAVQNAITEYSDKNPETQIRVRIGLHTGEAIKEEDDFFGKNVILAARIADQAQGGEILVSSLLKQLTESAGDIKFDEGRDVVLKGLSETQRVHVVVGA